MLYRLSKLIPVPMSSTYHTDDGPEHAVWIQWRDRVLWRRRSPL